jgi:rod shape-determining protein MreC
MHNLLDFLQKYHHWFLFIFLEVISGVMLFRYNSYQGSVWVSSANRVAGRFYEMESSVTSFFSLTRANEELTLRNFYLERQVDQLRRLYTDITKDTTVEERNQLQFLSQYKLIPAKVISNSINKPDNLMTINKGKADGVEVDMGVACGNGVVGIVYLVSDHYAVVIPVLNASSSRISCAIRNRDYFGYLHWTGGDPTIAYVEDIPRHAHFKKGEWVVTSGYSSIFPSGVLVGKIEKVFNSNDGLSYMLQVRLSTDFSCLRDVVVVSDKSISERVKLIEAARDSIRLKGN